jgi:hypothetical protein
MEGLTDPAVKREKEEALRALDNRLQTFKDIATMLDRVEAQLSGSVLNVMDAALSDVIRLQALGAAQAEKEVPAVLQQIRQQSEELEKLENEASRLA